MLKKYLIGTFAVAAFAIAFSASAAYDFGTTTLKVGSKGAAVMTLQTLVGANADGNFGPMTKAKVMVWQAANGLTADGVFGNMSKAKANAVATDGGSTGGTTGTTCPAGYVATTPVAPLFASCVASATTPSTLAGVTGEITSITQISSYNDEEVSAGQTDVKVMGFDVDTSKDGDVEVKSIKLTFDSASNGSTDSDRLNDYLTAVHVYAGSTKVGTANVADFTKDSTGVYSKTITLAGAVVKADTTAKMYVTVDAISNLDSGDIDSDSWTVGINNIRYVDGGGVTTTLTNADSMLTGNLDYDTAGDGVGMAFVSFATSADTELKISTDSTPAAAVVKVSTTNDTKGVVLLKGKLVLDGTSKVWLDEMPITLVSTGDSIDALTGSVTLTIGGNTYTESTGSNCVSTCASNTTAVVTFDNLDLDLAAGSTTTFVVTADINDTENTGVTATDFDGGDTLTASLLSTDRAAMVAENAEGDQLTDSTEISGSAAGNAQQFFAEGVNVVMGTATVTPTANTTTGDVTSVAYSIPVTVTAFGDTLYLGQTALNAATVSASHAFAFVFQNSGAPTTTDTSVTVSGITLETSDATIDTNGYALNEGEAKHFTLKATLTAGTNNTSYRVQVKQVQTFTEAGLVTGTGVTLSPDVNFRTGFQLLNN
ncbi:MAG: peptidoglycan-binding domain-containing protein [Candidatus Paceibacterota bacterium]